MNTKQTTCDDRSLLAMLQTDSGGREQEAILKHIEQCAYCQMRLEELAADRDCWRKAGEALSASSQGDDVEQWDGTRSQLSYSHLADFPVVWTESMARQLLSPPSHPEMLGRLGRYEVERLIGAGGMGVVFKAFDTELHRPVAIKVLVPYLAGSGPARKRFAREARAAAAIVHEHVVPIHNVETERDTPLLVMQYIAGESLQSRIDRTGPLETCEILRIGMQIASGLSAAHQQGLVHRDVKPSNVLLEQGIERALITDFGLARATDDATLTRSGVHPGTPQFMSPEQAQGEPVDARSDLFSLGSVLYTMCTGRPPFRAESTLSVLRRIADDEPRRIRQLNPNIPEWLCAIVQKLMAKAPADRYSCAADVAALLEQCLAHHQQPEFISLPEEAAQLQQDSYRSPFTRFLYRKARSPMTKILISTAAILGIIAYYWQSLPVSQAVASLQGEWLLVAAERDGNPTPKDQFFNERLVIDGNRYSRHQTAPDGTEIHADEGKLSIDQKDPAGTIDLKLSMGTIHGLYKLTGDELVLCVTREGGPRPDSFQTKAGDQRMLQTFRRTKKPESVNASAQTDEADKAPDSERDTTWAKSWMKRIPEQLSGHIPRDQVQQWMRDNGFENIVSEDITLDVMKRIHPGVDEAAMQRDGVRTYLHGLLKPANADDGRDAIEVYCLFDAADKLLALTVGPLVVEESGQTESTAHSRTASPVDDDDTEGVGPKSPSGDKGEPVKS